MNDARGEVGKPLLVSLLTIWGIAAVVYLIIRWLMNSYLESVRGSEIGLTLMMTTPGHAIAYAVFLSLLFMLHWWLSGLFGKKGFATRPVANLMLIAAGICVLLLLLDGATSDYLQFSVLCRPGEPTVTILVDDFYFCERSMLVNQTANGLLLALPLVAIPVRIIESRIGVRRK